MTDILSFYDETPNLMFYGSIIGLKLKDLGDIGTINIDLLYWHSIGPPADRAYAVLPVGVLTMIPSPLI